MRLIVLGPPGSGKGTVAKQLAEEFSLRHLSAGRLLRELVDKDTEVGRKIKKFIDKGDLVPENFVAEMMKLEVYNDDNYILDGFPRSLDQAEVIEKLPIQKVVFLEVPDEIVIDRLLKRGRHDDTKEIIQERLRVYRQETTKVIDYYKQKGLLLEIDGSPAPDVVYQDVKEKISDLK